MAHSPCRHTEDVLQWSSVVLNKLRFKETLTGSWISGQTNPGNEPAAFADKAGICFYPFEGRNNSNMVRRGSVMAIVICIGLFGGCDSPFSYSPFEARVAGKFRNTTAKNLQRIAQLDTLSGATFHVALLSDPHYHFDDLEDAIKDINARKEVVFVIVTGDLTENGLQKEYELFHDLMAASEKPYVTVIGNHDHLSNGRKVYEQVFGPRNYSFAFGGVKFVMWDNVQWESNQVPDWQWLRQELQQDTTRDGSESYQHVIPFAHIPPFDGQLIDSASVYDALLHRHHIRVSIHGHKHQYSDHQLFSSGIHYITAGSPQNRVYAMLTITPGQVTARKIEY